MIHKNQNRPVSVVMVGTGGYGHYYTQLLIKEYHRGLIDIRAAVEPFPDQSSHSSWFLKQSIPVYSNLEQVYEDHLNPDLVIISSPIHCHVPQSLLSLKQGSHVLCDKPLASTVQDALQMVKIKNKTKFHLMVGYQWSYTSSIQALKKDIHKGLFGKPLQMKTLCLWPRGWEYYRRNDWAGKVKDEQGHWILDSPANNAMAHFLHNLLYLLGDQKHTSALPCSVEAEAYKAYSIDNFDSIACRLLIDDGVTLLFYASHTVQNSLGPLFKLEFENATITYGETAKKILCQDQNGTIKDYGNPDSENQFKKFYESIKVIKNLTPAVCGPEAAYPHTLAVNGIQESVPEPGVFPSRSKVKSQSEERLWIKNWGETLYNCYLNSSLPSERKIKWAKKGKQIDLRNYRFFPGGDLK
ncbi:MAG: gfo/Idh/MocA family oxidoreductase [Candidatus Aminicenantes bacterium]|nr:gfo/Idh/MocA family oxidoreductase [Candidatus Aminicenantes bacterium]